MKSFNNKIAVITGAGSGIGRSLAAALGERGATVALCDIDAQGLGETANLLPNSTQHIADVSDRAQMYALAEEVIAAHSTVDVLINNAGITLTPRLFEDITDEEFERVININMWGVYNGVRAFLPHLRTRPEASIVNMSSLAGLLGLMGYSPYAMSKFAVRALGETLQMELVGTNISVTNVHPGGVKTNIMKNAPDLPEGATGEVVQENFTKGALLTPEKAAEQILKAVQKKKPRIILGADAKIVNLLRALFPNRFVRFLNPMFAYMMQGNQSK